MDNIFVVIDSKYNSLSKTFKLIADYVKESYSLIPFLSIQELKEEIGVSTASITRFSQEIGFSGYPAFQKEIKEMVHSEITPMKQVRSFISSDENENILLRTIELNIKTLESTYTENLNKSFEEAVEIIKGARKIYIVGARSSYAVAYYLSFMLGQFMENIEIITAGTVDTFDRLSYLKEDDILISISFSQYTKFTKQVTEYFHKRGNKVIAVTDSYSSPIAIKANTTLLTKSSSTTYSFVSAMTVLNALIIQIGKLDKNKTLEIMKEKQRIAIENDIYA